VNRIPSGANAIGLVRAGVVPSARDAQSMLREPRAGYVLYGIEPGLDFVDQALALKALTGAKVVAFSHFACESTRSVADVILPIGALPEIDATLTNLDGREQRAIAGGKLPGQARAGWRVLRALGNGLELPGFEFTDLAGLRATLADDENPRDRQAGASAVVPAPQSSAIGLEVVVSQAIYRSDAVTRRAPALQAHPLTTGPLLHLHQDDAKRLGLVDAAMAKIDSQAGTGALQISINDRVAPGCVWLEAGYEASAPLTASGHVEVSPV